MLRRFVIPSVQIRRNVSALFVTGDKAKENFAVLTPCMKFNERFENLEELKENLKRRHFKINIEDVMTEYSLYKSVEDKKTAMEKRREEITKLLKSKPENAEGLIIQARQLREDLKTLKENSYYLEDEFVHNYLRIPNFIHKDTPDELKIIYNFKEDHKNDQVKMNGNIDDHIEYFDSSCYYMKGEAAKFDLFMPMKVMEMFADRSFTFFSNPDFVRSVLPEGAGIDIKNLFLLTEDDIENKLNLLHFTGNASFVNFLGYITKLSTFPSLFPMKFICTGRQYNAENHHDHQDIYNAVQSTCVQTFVADADSNSFDEIIGEQIEIYKKIFEKFDQHFRIVYYPASQLQMSESFKLGVEMFSPSKKNYIQVANFSYYNNFISKRLLFNYKVGKEFKFPHIYSGTAVNNLKLSLVLLENCRNFKYPEWLN